MTWRLRGRYTALQAELGVADIVRPQGDMEVVWLGDGKEIFAND